MDGVWWQLIWINLATPSLPFIFPIRVAVILDAATHLPWWAVLGTASIAGAIGMLPVYAIARWHAADRWHRRIERYPSLIRLRHRWRSNMFVVQVLLHATPVPEVVASGLAGCERYPVWRFLLAQLVGRICHNLPLVVGGLLLADVPWFQKALHALQHPVTWLVIAGLGGLWWYIQRRSAQDEP